MKRQARNCEHVRYALIAAFVTATITSAAPPPALDALLPAHVEPVYRALDAAFEPRVAMETVLFMDQFWRLAGNPDSTRRRTTSSRS